MTTDWLTASPTPLGPPPALRPLYDATTPAMMPKMNALISPVQRLVVPRVLGCVLVSVFLNGMVCVVGVAGGYFFNVVLQGGTPGAYLASFSALAQLPDLYTGELKAFIFGLIAGVVAAYKGLNVGGGPKGVGDAVNQSVVITFMLLFAVNFVITAVYFQVVPAKGS